MGKVQESCKVIVLYTEPHDKTFGNVVKLH